MSKDAKAEAKALREADWVNARLVECTTAPEVHPAAHFIQGLSNQCDRIVFVVGCDTLPTLEQVQREFVRAVLAKLGGNKTQTAVALGVDRRTIYRWLRNIAVAQGEQQ